MAPVYRDNNDDVPCCHKSEMGGILAAESASRLSFLALRRTAQRRVSNPVRWVVLRCKCGALKY